MEILRKIQFLLHLSGWRLLLDVAVIAAAFFGLYRILRASGTWKIVSGILLAATVLGLADLLRLQGVMWVYTQLSPVVLVALVVIFQPEIRRIFERTATLRRRDPVRGRSDLPALLAEALFKLAERHWGAILVVPGNEPIDRWVTGGTDVNAAPSVPLLLSVFDPHSPGHDGAATIENGRIGRIGLVLPLGASEELPEGLGTRHQAALGLSQVCDALVVAVSEERGTVMLFSAGRIAAARGPADVDAHIFAHRKRSGFLSLAPEERRRWWADLPAVAVCLVLAGWIAGRAVIERSEVVERSIAVPVEYVTPDGMALVGEKPAAVTAHLAGSVSAIDEAAAADRKIKIDLSRALAGRQTVYVTEADLDLPRGVSLLGVEPEGLDLVLRAIREIEVPVRAQLVGETPAGLVIGRVEVVPATVRAFTPADTEGETTALAVSTSPIYLQEVRGTTRIAAKIVAPPHVIPVGGRWPDVEVRIEARERRRPPR